MSFVITPQVLLNAYSQGIFPMADDADGQVYWYDPDPRAILPLENFHVPRRLARTVRQQPYEIRVDTAFRAVMQACAGLGHERGSTWISPELLELYTELHDYGYAHSVECWHNDELVGGLYGISLRGLFAGESMFSLARDASKVALVHLVEILRAGGYRLLDTQFVTEHLRQFGVIEIPRDLYKHRLAQAMRIHAEFAV